MDTPTEIFPGWIIPAYAGSTPANAVTFAVFRDHPRIRGEHALSELLTDDVRGSSPHTRGAPWLGWLAAGQ